jgi:hypothetical protein
MARRREHWPFAGIPFSLFDELTDAQKLEVDRREIATARSAIRAALQCRRVAVAGCGNPRLEKCHAHSADAAMGMAWFNSMNERERFEALRAANTSVPAEAWAHWKATGGYTCEETAHG